MTMTHISREWYAFCTCSLSIPVSSSVSYERGMLLGNNLLPASTQELTQMTEANKVNVQRLLHRPASHNRNDCNLHDATSAHQTSLQKKAHVINKQDCYCYLLHSNLTDSVISDFTNISDLRALTCNVPS